MRAYVMESVQKEMIFGFKWWCQLSLLPICCIAGEYILKGGCGKRHFYPLWIPDERAEKRVTIIMRLLLPVSCFVVAYFAFFLVVSQVLFVVWSKPPPLVRFTLNTFILPWLSFCCIQNNTVHILVCIREPNKWYVVVFRWSYLKRGKGIC